MKKKRKFWTDKYGVELTFSEFMQRWKQGIEGLTPLQTTRTQYHSTKIIIIGILFGIIVSIMAIKQLWWVLIILVGTLGNVLMQLVSLWQKIKALENIEAQFNSPVGEEGQVMPTQTLPPLDVPFDKDEKEVRI